MKLASVRNLESLKTVLKDRGATGPDLAYWVFGEIGGKWANVTIVVPGSYNGEFVKTFGHYHPQELSETCRVVEGEGVMVAQKKHLEGGAWTPEMVDEVLLVSAGVGDEIVVNPGYAHSWSNVGSGPLILLDNWQTGHSPTDYSDIERLGGMAYYLVEQGGKPGAVPNSNYKDLPQPVWLTAEEFAKRTQ